MGNQYIKYGKLSITIVSIISSLSYISSVYLPIIFNYTGLDPIIALPVSVIIFLILDRFIYDNSANIDKNQMKAAIDDFDENMNDLKSLLAQSKVIDNGSITVANEKIAKKIATADWVKNVYVSNPDSEKDKQQRAIIVKAYENWLENKSRGDWIDIVGIQELFSNRFREIKPRRQNGAHKVYVLRHSTPTINFLILGKGRNSEVFMGWLPEYKMNIDHYKIFSSRDRISLMMFNGYFDYLKDNKTWNDKGIPYKLDFEKSDQRRYANVVVVEKKGLWTTLGIEGDSESNLKVLTIGFVDIDLDADAVTVRAAVYDYRGNSTPEISNVPHEEIAHYKNDIYVGYELEDRTSGICHYRFRRSSIAGEYVLGTFVHKVTGQRTALIGSRSIYSSFDQVCALTESEIGDTVSSQMTTLKQRNLLRHFRGPIFHDREDK